MYGGPNSITCQNSITLYLNSFTTYIPNNIAAGSVYGIIYSILSPVQQLYTLENTCFGGVAEAGNQILRYSNGYPSAISFFDTFAFNFGLLYDSVITAMIAFQNGNNFMSGYALGNILYLIFFLG